MSRKPKPVAAADLTAAGLRALSKAQLADAFGPILRDLKPLEKRAELFKAEFESRGVTLLVGETFSVQRSETSFDGVDVVAARAALGVEWCEAHKKPVKRVTWKPVALKDADRAAGDAA